MWKSANGLGEWPNESIGAIHEIRLFFIPSDAIVMGGPFEVARAMLGRYGCITGEGDWKVRVESLKVRL